MNTPPEQQPDRVRAAIGNDLPNTNWKQIAALAEANGMENEKLDCLLRSLQENRNDTDAYLQLARSYHKSGEDVTSYLMLKEAQRTNELPEPDAKRLNSLENAPLAQNESILNYKSFIGEYTHGKTNRPLRILVVTNLFPPQELGGYGRTMWEFCDLLQKRGHCIHILTSDSSAFHKDAPPERMILEEKTDRCLDLFGGWEDGRAEMTKNTATIVEKMGYNERQILAAIDSHQADVCMLGNIDFVGWEFLKKLTARGIPILHRLGNEYPGYNPEVCPTENHFCIAGCSEWLNQGLRNHGFPVKRYAVVPPGSPIEDYYRFILPSFKSLRICFASLLLPYKGPHTLVQALATLKQNGIPFTCELAGDSKEPEFMEKLERFVRENAMDEQVKFTGFLNKKDLAALYARSNVMVFPSVFDEPFGKTQIEAMASGCVVVSSGTGGSAEIVQDLRNGLLFEKDNPASLAEKLVLLYQNPSDAEILAAQGQIDAFNFTSSKSIETIESQFAAMLDELSETV